MQSDLTIDLEAGCNTEITVRAGLKQTATAAFILLRHIPDNYGAVLHSIIFKLHFISKIRTDTETKLFVVGGNILLPTG